ncbi:MAK10-like protein [Tanacetum coccineum]
MLQIILRYFLFGRHLEDLHVTWAHLEKKRARLQTNTKTLEDLCSQSLETVSQAIHDAVTTHKVTASQHFETASARIDSHADLEDSTYDGSIFSLCYLFRNSFSLTTIRDENPIRTLGDYSKPSHEGYRNTIELPVGNNVVPLQFDTIWLVQNGCSFYGLWSEDPNQHLKDFLKLVDSLDLDGDNRKRTRLHLFQFSLRNQASNWLERLPAGSITTWEDLTTRFLTKFFPPRRTVKLRNDILMFQQHHGESLSEAWTRFKDLLQKVPHHGIDRWLQIQIFYNHVSFHLKCEIDHAAGGKLRNKNTEESWEIIENLSLYDHEGCPSPQRQALKTTFETRARDYIAAHTERIERFKNTIFKQREEINGRMTEMFGLLKELTTIRTPKKVLIREEAKFPVTKNVNSISLAKGEEEKSNERKVTPDNTEKPIETGMKIPVKEVKTKDEAENRAGNESIKTPESEEVVEAPGSQPVAYYLKHKINEKLIKGLVNNNRFNNSLSGT